MNDRNRALPAPASLAKASIRWGAVLAAALLCACSTSSSWRASSAASTSPRVAKAKPVDAPYEREEVSYATPLGGGAAGTPDPAANSGSAQAAPVGTTYGDEGGMQSGAPQDAGAAQTPKSAAQDAAAGAGSDSRDPAARAEAEPGADASGSTAAREDSLDDVQAATAQDSASAGAEASGEAGREGTDAWSEADASGREGDASAASGASDESAGAGADTVAGAQNDHTAAMHAGDETLSGQAGSTAEAQTAVQPDSTAGASATIAAADGSMDATVATAGSGQQADMAVQEPLMVGVVEAPGKKATRNEEVIPLTLGGLLPMTLGVDGQGEFDFDQAVLRDQVKELLDMLVSRLKSAEYDRIEIVGHTDRIGAEDYNQYLSERRAWAVARYLAKQGVPVTKMQVEGRGMHEPVTGVHECGAKDIARDQLIVCLQKDRRVVISASIRKVDVNVQ
jgi:OOP family OmpA-OmpF porin